MTLIESDNGRLVYQPTKVVYRGKEFQAPVFLRTLLAWDYIYELLKEKKK